MALRGLIQGSGRAGCSGLKWENVSQGQAGATGREGGRGPWGRCPRPGRLLEGFWSWFASSQEAFVFAGETVHIKSLGSRRKVRFYSICGISPPPSFNKELTARSWKMRSGPRLAARRRGPKHLQCHIRFCRGHGLWGPVGSEC